MSASEQDLLTARLFFRAAFPVMKVPLRDDPAIKRAFADVVASVQFSAGADDGKIGAYLLFDRGEFSSAEGFVENPDITLHFPTVAKMNAMLAGGAALPRIKGIGKIGLLIKVLRLLLSLTLMLPRSRPKDQLKRYLKVKMSLYMITTALSAYNKLGGAQMTDWTSGQPDRIYQFTVEPYDDEHGIAAYLRVKAGKTKAGRGVYRKRAPFVHFRFQGVDGALPVLLKEVGFVESVEKGMIAIDGSPEYASAVNDRMAVLQGLMT